MTQVRTDYGETRESARREHVEKTTAVGGHITATNVQTALQQLDGSSILSVVNDTNVTGSIASNTLTLGWAGTLAAARLNANVVQAVVNDTNIQGSVSAQTLTFSWGGTLGAARLNANVVQSVTNDTNVTGSIAAQNLTLGWAGTLANGRLASMAANTLKGNPTGAPTNPTDITLGATLAFSGSALQTGAGSGDVTWSANSYATTIAAAAVTYAKMQNVAASRLLGNPTGGVAAPSEITLGATLAFSGSAVQTGAGSGDVTWSANSFTTTIAASAVTNSKLANMAAWTLKGNVTSGAAAPTDFTIDGLTNKVTPAGADEIIIWDVAGTAIKKALISSLPAGSASGALVSVVTYSSTQTITIPATATKAFIRMSGGSGGSGGISNVPTIGATGGTGAGGYLEKYSTGLTPGNTLAYTQGASGAAGANTGGNGGNGTASTLAAGTQAFTTLTANGSNGSTGTAANGSTAGTAGGTATNGDYNAPAVAGQSGLTADGNTVSVNTGGFPGVNMFNSGAVGAVTPGSTATVGKAGNAGVLVIMWFQ